MSLLPLHNEILTTDQTFVCESMVSFWEGIWFLRMGTLNFLKIMLLYEVKLINSEVVRIPSHLEKGNSWDNPHSNFTSNFDLSGFVASTTDTRIKPLIWTILVFNLPYSTAAMCLLLTYPIFITNFCHVKAALKMSSETCAVQKLCIFRNRPVFSSKYTNRGGFYEKLSPQKYSQILLTLIFALIMQLLTIPQTVNTDSVCLISFDNWSLVVKKK